jgi:two-component system, NtrC family, response regulator AtoC
MSYRVSWNSEPLKSIRGVLDPGRKADMGHKMTKPESLVAPYITGLVGSRVVLQPLLDEIPLGLAVLSVRREIVLINRAMEVLTGFAQSDVKGIPCAYVLRSNICVTECPFLRNQDFSGNICDEGDIINRDRQKISVWMTFAAIRDPGGKITGFLETLEDIRAHQESGGKISSAYGFGGLVGRSLLMERLFQILPAIAQSDSSVLLTGETGVGKDLVAETIHQSSERARYPFIKVNCGALPETLMESELFGHQKGAFTGAVENKPGRFRLSHNGTLYLTEIGDLPLSLQVKLLTFLDDKVVYPLGSAKGFRVNVRVIAATHRNLERMVREGHFREDLLFRLNVVRLHLPPLKERGDDVRLLLDHFLDAFIATFGKPVKGISPKALRIMMAYPYPGNVRELKNIIEYALNVCQDDLIQPGHLPAYLTDASFREPSKTEEQGETAGLALSGRTAAGEEVDWTAMERRLIMEALVKAKGRRSKAAGILGWGRSTLWRKMKHYGLDG